MRVGFTLALVFAGILAVYLLLAVGSICYSECKTMQKINLLTEALAAFSLRKIAKKFKLGASLLNKMKISSFQM